MNISDFATLFDCTIWAYNGRDIYGNPNFAAPVFLPKSIWYGATSKLFKDSNGNELTAKYEIQASGNLKDNFKVRYYIAFDDQTSVLDPTTIDAHEIKSSRLLKVPFVGLDDELEVMV